MVRQARWIGWIIVLAAVIAVGLGVAGITDDERPALTRVEAGLRDLLAPLQTGITVVWRSLEDTWGAFVAYEELQQENAALRNQLRQLATENSLLAEYRLENMRLRRLLGLQEEMAGQYQLLAAEVIGRRVPTWYTSLELNRGLADGAAVGMAVVNEDGLVGRVAAVSQHTAEVHLLTSPQVGVAAMAQDSRVPGVVQGGREAGLLEMIHLPHDAPIQVGEIVVSSGWGGVFPPGLRIGTVKEIIPDPNGLMKKAVLEPAADIDRVEEAFIITGVTGGD